MSSVVSRMQKFTFQQKQPIHRAGTLPLRAYTAEEIRADRLYAARYEQEDKALVRLWRKTQRPVFSMSSSQGAIHGHGAWVRRKTPDRSVRRQARRIAALIAGLHPVLAA